MSFSCILRQFLAETPKENESKQLAQRAALIQKKKQKKFELHEFLCLRKVFFAFFRLEEEITDDMSSRLTWKSFSLGIPGKIFHAVQ